MCSPALTTFLTGLIPSQHGLHFILDPKFTMGPEAYIWPVNSIRFSIGMLPPIMMSGKTAAPRRSGMNRTLPLLH